MEGVRRSKALWDRLGLEKDMSIPLWLIMFLLKFWTNRLRMKEGDSFGEGWFDEPVGIAGHNIYKICLQVV
jgi:hypothetical protein